MRLADLGSVKGIGGATFTVLDQDHVDGFLQHSHQPIIRFTMEVEEDNTIPFLDTTTTRDSDGLFTTTF